MRLAAFNVENMFERARVMNLDTWQDGRNVLEDFARLNELVQENVYTDAVAEEILQTMKRHKGLIANGESKFIRLRDIRGRLLRKPKSGPVEVAAAGRHDWIGWFELRTEAVKETATLNTARIIDLVAADIICVVEADHRVNLTRFNRDVLPSVSAARYEQVMLIDGNDDRGIDVGILARNEYRISRMRSHVDDADIDGVIFSRDCAEYEVTTPNGASLLILINHFKSKGYGTPAESNAKRLRQARRVREIVDERLADFPLIAVVGDLNEVPNGAPLDPLLRDGSSLTDIMEHPLFVGDGRPGTYANGTKSNKLDYILMSPALANAVQAGGIERRGVWGGKHGDLFPHLDQILSSKDAASDHAALWAEFAI